MLSCQLGASVAAELVPGQVAIIATSAGQAFGAAAKAAAQTMRRHADNREHSDNVSMPAEPKGRRGIESPQRTKALTRSSPIR
jgi:hypothetical protein